MGQSVRDAPPITALVVTNVYRIQFSKSASGLRRLERAALMGACSATIARSSRHPTRYTTGFGRPCQAPGRASGRSACLTSPRAEFALCRKFALAGVAGAAWRNRALPCFGSARREGLGRCRPKRSGMLPELSAGVKRFLSSPGGRNQRRLPEGSAAPSASDRPGVYQKFCALSSARNFRASAWPSQGGCTHNRRRYCHMAAARVKCFPEKLFRGFPGRERGGRACVHFSPLALPR